MNTPVLVHSRGHEIAARGGRYIAEIKPNCDWIKDNFKPRAEARKTEMDGQLPYDGTNYVLPILKTIFYNYYDLN